MPLLFLRMQFLISTPNINAPEYFITPRANYSTLWKTLSKLGKGVNDLSRPYVASLYLILYMVRQKIILSILKPQLFPPFPLARKHRTFILLRFYI